MQALIDAANRFRSSSATLDDVLSLARHACTLLSTNQTLDEAIAEAAAAEAHAVSPAPAVDTAVPAAE